MCALGLRPLLSNSQSCNTGTHAIRVESNFPFQEDQQDLTVLNTSQGSTEQGCEHTTPTQLPELREHVHNKEAVIRLILHHRVQSEVHVRELSQAVEPEYFC